MRTAVIRRFAEPVLHRLTLAAIPAMDRDRELSAYCHSRVASGSAGYAKEEQRVSVARRCIDSSQYSAQIMAEHRAVVRFSGTVSL